MLDPFPLAPPPLLTNLVRPWAEQLGLKTLPFHAHEILAAFAFYHVLNAYVSPWLSIRLFPRSYGAFSTRTRLSWDVHVVSLLQSTLISGLALWVIFGDDVRAEMNWKGRIWGYTGAIGMIQGLAAGYFLWDLLVSIVHLEVFGWGFVVHALSALVVFLLGFRPFVNHYAPIFILYELSSPFLNFHWFFDKLDMTGSSYQLYNGIALILTFFGCRIVFGGYQSVLVFSDVWRALDHQRRPLHQHGHHDPLTGVPAVMDAGGSSSYLKEPRSEMMRFAGDETLPLWLGVSYLASNLVLHALNLYWFGKMIEAIRKRFGPPFGTRKPGDDEGEREARAKARGEAMEKKADGAGGDKAGLPDGGATARGETQVARGLYEDGRKTVEVEKREVRSRRRG